MKAILITAMLTLLCGPGGPARAMPEAADAAAQTQGAEQTTPDSPVLPDHGCRPGKCFFDPPEDDETEQPPDATGLEIMRAIRDAEEK